MIRAIVFDCFGVLATDGWLPFKQHHFGHDAHLFDEATNLGRATDAGLLDHDDFIEQVAQLAGVSAEAVRKQVEYNVPNEPLFAYIAHTLKSKYKLGLLSNAGDNWLHELFTPEQVALFDAVALSYETGVLKPAPRAYEIIAERLGVEPGECVLIDDQERYCAGAQDAGMRAICYQSVEQTTRELAELLGKAS